jgi:hypothetical protein
VLTLWLESCGSVFREKIGPLVEALLDVEQRSVTGRLLGLVDVTPLRIARSLSSWACDPIKPVLNLFVSSFIV